MELLRRIAGIDQTSCAHVPGERAEPTGTSCSGCGSTTSLRLCATCGHVGCCESQAGHAAEHAKATGHPVIYQMPADSGFVWCYKDRQYVG